MNTTFKKQYACYFTAEQITWLHTQAALQECSIAEIVRQCIDTAAIVPTPPIQQDLITRADSLLETLIKRFPDFADMRTLETQTLWFDQYVKIIHDIGAFQAKTRRDRIARRQPDPVDVRMAELINERWD